MTSPDSNSLPKVCVILGAGASYDVHSAGSLIRDGAFRPPLARDLFNYDLHPNYHEILEAYPGAAVLAQSLAPKALSGELNLESELRRFAKHPNEQIRQHFKHIPPYLRDLLQNASSRYVTEPSCYIQLVVELLAEVPHEVMFLVLNCDTLLEKAITSFNPTWQFTTMDDYIRNDGRPKVVKLHGSVNWFKNIGPLGNRIWRDYVQETNVLSKPPENEIEVLSPSGGDIGQRVADIRIGRNWVYPVLTAPLAGKEILDAVCPYSHIESAKEFLASCRKFLIIGTSGLDDDLLSLLNDSVPPIIKPTIQIVGSRDVEPALERFERRVQAFRNRRITPPGYQHDRGFRAYIASGELSQYAAFDPKRNG